jgi:NitT/TauT family transport system permease protein
MNRRPRHAWPWALLPFALLLGLYAAGSAARLADNPGDKLMPGMVAMASALYAMALEVDARTGTLLFWADTAASLARLATGLGIAAFAGLALGLTLGVLPLARATFGPLVTAGSMVPALAVLPILFIVLGVGEVSKVALIVVGTLPFIVRDLTQRAREIPEEQWIKAQTLGASTLQLAVRIVLPQLLPRLIDSVRLSLGPAWLFLISAEAISATSGLGYRIFLVRRYLAMDVILPYVCWITLLAFASDQLLRRLRSWRYAWVESEAA